MLERHLQGYRSELLALSDNAKLKDRLAEMLFSAENQAPASAEEAITTTRAVFGKLVQDGYQPAGLLFQSPFVIRPPKTDLIQLIVSGSNREIFLLQDWQLDQSLQPLPTPIDYLGDQGRLRLPDYGISFSPVPCRNKFQTAAGRIIAEPLAQSHAFLWLAENDNTQPPDFATFLYEAHRTDNGEGKPEAHTKFILQGLLNGLRLFVPE